MELFVFLAFALLFVSISRKYIFLFFSFAVLFILSAYREYTVGTDTINYLLHFENVFVTSETRLEFAWNWLNRTVADFGGDFTDLLVLSALLYLFPMYWVVYKDSKNANLSIFLYFSLYFYSYSLNIVRQMIAVSFVLLAFHLIQRHKKLFAIAVIFLASLFHLSALIALPMVFIEKLKLREQVYLFLVGFSFMIGLFFIQQLISFAQFIPYAHYLRSELGNISGNMVYLMIFNSFFLFIFFVTKERSFYFHLFFVFVLIENLMARIPFSERVVLFNSIAQIIFFPEVISNNKLKEKWIVALVVFLYAFFIFFRQLGNGGIFPYQNLLF